MSGSGRPQFDIQCAGARAEYRQSSTVGFVKNVSAGWPYERPAAFSTLAIRLGTPNSRRQISASTATPSRMSACDGLPKHSRIRLLP